MWREEYKTHHSKAISLTAGSSDPTVGERCIYLLLLKLISHSEELLQTQRQRNQNETARVSGPARPPTAPSKRRTQPQHRRLEEGFCGFEYQLRHNRCRGAGSLWKKGVPVLVPGHAFSSLILHGVYDCSAKTERAVKALTAK